MTSFLLDDRKILIPILINAMVLFALGFSDLPMDAHRPLILIDDAFTLLFFFEMVVKVRTWGWPTYIRSNWNKLDFVLVILSLGAFGEYLLAPDNDTSLEFLLVLRVCRVFKFFRFLRFIPGIDHMLLGVRRAVQASVMLFLAFFIGLFMVSLLSSKLFGAIEPEAYGDPLRAMYSTFKIFTVEGWYEIPDRIAAQLSGPAAFFTRVYFIGLLLGAGIMGLSLVNSVFVDAMVADNTDALEQKVDALRDEIAALRRELRGDRGDRGDDPPAQEG